MGILTYQLLTGNCPYHITSTNRKEILDSIEQQTITHLSSQITAIKSKQALSDIAQKRSTTSVRLVKTLDGDIDTILIKALHKEPQRRYQSIAAFSEDIERYISGEPVMAKADSSAYRLSLFINRHKIGVAMTSMLMVVLISSLVLISNAWLEADNARAEAEAAKTNAEQRYNQVRSIARTLMFDIYENIEKIPGTASAREKLALTAQQYLETLLNGPEIPNEIQLEAAKGYSRLASIYNRQAVSKAESRKIAKIASEKALDLLNNLTDSPNATSEAYHTLANLQSNQGSDLIYINNTPLVARKTLDQAIDNFSKAIEMTPDDLQIRIDKFLAQKRIASSYKWQNDYEQSALYLENTLQEVRSLNTDNPENSKLIKIQADIIQNLGEASYFMDQYPSAIRYYQQAIELYLAALENAGKDNKINNALVITYWSLGNTLVDSERPADAEVSYNKSIKILEQQRLIDPDDANVARRWAIIKGSKAAAIVELDKVDEAIAIMEETNQWFEKQAQKEPDTPGTQRSVAVNYHMMGNIFNSANRKAEACQWWRKTLDAWLVIDKRFGLSEFDSNEPAKLNKLLTDC